MLFSVGKDNSVILHIAMKAFYPNKPPFPFLYIDTTWKFKEMIELRDKHAKELGFELLVCTNEAALRQGINLFDHDAAYTDIMNFQILNVDKNYATRIRRGNNETVTSCKFQYLE